MYRLKRNYMFYFTLFFSIIIISSEANERKTMCSKYTQQVCAPSQRILHNKDDVNLIVGGKITLPKQYPHMALIGNQISFGISWRCGGSLISRSFVLTAAHCLMKPSPQWIRLGESDLGRTTEDATPYDFKIIETFTHPGFKRISFQNDIALVRFPKLSEFTDYIRPICLNVFENIPRNQKLIALGWGLTKYHGKISKQLRSVDLNIENGAKCGFRFDGYSDRMKICAGYAPGGKDTCQGDSGGPLLISNNQSKCSRVPTYTQVGITSNGIRCALPNIPAEYTRVSYFIPWIEKIVWGKNYE